MLYYLLESGEVDVVVHLEGGGGKQTIELRHTCRQVGVVRGNLRLPCLDVQLLAQLLLGRGRPLGLARCPLSLPPRPLLLTHVRGLRPLRRACLPREFPLDLDENATPPRHQSPTTARMSLMNSRYTVATLRRTRQRCFETRQPFVDVDEGIWAADPG
jgi:hypothetical protein